MVTPQGVRYSLDDNVGLIPSPPSPRVEPQESWGKHTGPTSPWGIGSVEQEDVSECKCLRSSPQ